MKILKGSLTETRYAWPTVAQNNAEDHPLKTLSSKTYQENQVTYMSDKLGLHRISNPDPNGYAVSLHCKRSLLYLLTLTDDDEYTHLQMRLYMAATYSMRVLGTRRTPESALFTPNMAHARVLLEVLETRWSRWFEATAWWRCWPTMALSIQVTTSMDFCETEIQ
jgi:hypothetical protein